MRKPNEQLPDVEAVRSGAVFLTLPIQQIDLGLIAEFVYTLNMLVVGRFGR